MNPLFKGRQISMIIDLNKCIGCQTCSSACKSLWTDGPGQEYMLWNNVETMPGEGYPRRWEESGGGYKNGVLQKNGKLPSPADYGSPQEMNHEQVFFLGKDIKVRGKEKMEYSAHWNEDTSVGEYPNNYHFYLPRLCNHCTNPACLEACPTKAIYKREQDGIVLIDQDKCRGWRMCVSACPYKKIYYNWKSGKSEKCILCYPRIEMGEPTVCAETCVGRIRYLGVMLYDADRIEAAASVAAEKDLYQAHLDIFLDPNDPQVIDAARKEGIPDSWLEAARASPVYKLAIDWKLALPLHPEYRTLPMVWYVPPLSPIQSAADAGRIGRNGEIPDVRSLRIPVHYLANLLTAGDDAPVVRALERMLAMRAWRRAMNVDGVEDTEVLRQVGLTVAQAEEMYRYLAIANYEDRFVIPTAHREYANDAFGERGGCGFTFGNGCSGTSPADLFSARKTTTYVVHPNRQEKTKAVP